MGGHYTGLHHALVASGKLDTEAADGIINQMIDNDQNAAGCMLGHVTDSSTTSCGVHAVGNPPSGQSLLDELLGGQPSTGVSTTATTGHVPAVAPQQHHIPLADRI
jgi:hypothetical protein